MITKLHSKSHIWYSSGGFEFPPLFPNPIKLCTRTSGGETKNGDNQTYTALKTLQK